MGSISKLELLDRLGFDRDPFKSVNFNTCDNSRISRILSMAVKSKAMISIVGERGMGKSRTVQEGLKKLNVRQVVIRSADKVRLLIGDIERAIIFDLSDENPKRGSEIRARQLRRIIGEASRKHEIVLVIEEGHRLHGMTLRALKTLREMDWMGETELFTVVLIGQSDPMNKAGVAEVRLRTDTVSMQGLTPDEIAGYIKATMGKVFSNECLPLIKSIPEARNYLNLQNILISILGRAVANGRNKAIADDVTEELGITQPEAVKQADIHTVDTNSQKGSGSIRAVLAGH